VLRIEILFFTFCFYMLQKLIFLSEFFVLMYEHFCNFLHLVLEIASALSCGIAFYTFVLPCFPLGFSNIAYKRKKKVVVFFNILTPPLFIERPVANQESDRSCISLCWGYWLILCFLQFIYWILNCSDCVILFGFFKLH